VSQFAFLRSEFPELLESAQRSEALANSDPRAACFYARRTLELLVSWAYENDPTLILPYRDDLSALIHERTFRNLVGDSIFYKCRAIKDTGNVAVHDNRQVTTKQSHPVLRELHHVCFWFARTYAKDAKPDPSVQFDPSQLPTESGFPSQSKKELEELNDKLEVQQQAFLEAIQQRDEQSDEIKALQAEIARIKAENAQVPDTHNYNEAITRKYLIDKFLHEAGWELDQERDQEYEVSGMPSDSGIGFVDYVLWGDNGLPLAIVEAKRTQKDPRIGQHQAKLYAECLEQMHGQRPIIFYSNGYKHWIWDELNYPPREVQGFYKKDELELLVQRRSTRQKLKSAPINAQTVERYYQTRAIRKIGQTFEDDNRRKALLVMATGSGKTRTVIALCEQLMQANWVKRVLFLADRKALVNQAMNAFVEFLPNVATVNLLKDKTTEGRAYVSTYPTMISLIEDSDDGKRRFGPGHFDLIVIDEAHRSIFLKYKSIFDYFDSLLVGLTATPKDEIAKNTYQVFDLENGSPTDAYTLQEAVDEGFLVPPVAISVPLRIPDRGVNYDELSEEEKEHFDLTDWKERDEKVKQDRRVEPSAINNWLFNIPTVDASLKFVMERGIKVDQGDKLGKTIIFARNHKHAQLIAERFNIHYPQYKGEFAQVIDFEVKYAQSLIDSFSDPAKSPQIAISVDMLDTGIDVPEILNLVFFKPVRSRTKFWQMIGRGTRLCKDIFGPGHDKENFAVFDFCRNLEYFSQDLGTSEGDLGVSLSTSLFRSRVELIRSLMEHTEGHVHEDRSTYEGRGDLRSSLIESLKSQVQSMNADNFIVRTKLEFVEKFQNAENWKAMTGEELDTLSEHIAGLPSTLPSEKVETKRFDLLMVKLQHSLLTQNPSFQKLKKLLQNIASALEEAFDIPAIKHHAELIEEIQLESWWQDVTLTMLEQVRLRLRNIVHLVEPGSGSTIVTNFSDEIGEESTIKLPGLINPNELERFRQRAKAFLRNYLGSNALQKIRLNIPVNDADLAELEEILSSLGPEIDSLVPSRTSTELTSFIRSLIGLDRGAAKSIFGEFLAGSSHTPEQIEFVNQIIDYLTEHGSIKLEALYEPPFKDIAPTGPNELFNPDDFEKLISSINSVGP
jgi:type I restriction enzyme, R subunit